MTLDELKKVGSKIDAEITAVFAKYGIQTADRRAKIDQYTGELTWNIRAFAGTKDAQAGADPRKAALASSYKREAEWNGLKPEWLGMSFEIAVTGGMQEFMVVGLDPRKRKQPIVCESRGKMYMFTCEQIIRYASQGLLRG